MKKNKSEIKGHLDIVIANNEHEFEGEITKWHDILIHGDPEGLRSFAQLLLRIASINQNDLTDLPVGAREHIHLQPNLDLSKSSLPVIVGRLDAKGTKGFYDKYVPKDDAKK